MSKVNEIKKYIHKFFQEYESYPTCIILPIDDYIQFESDYTQENFKYKSNIHNDTVMFRGVLIISSGSICNVQLIGNLKVEMDILDKNIKKSLECKRLIIEMDKLNESVKKSLYENWKENDK